MPTEQTCASCRSARPEVEMQADRDLMWRPTGKVVCRDREACFQAYLAIPLGDL